MERAWTPFNFTHTEFGSRLVLISLGSLIFSILIGTSFYVFNRQFKTHHLILVAGSQDGESYILSKAIEAVIEAKKPRIQIDVIETSGTSENLRKLEAGEAQLATAQADIKPPGSARIVAFLYPDFFQLIVKNNTQIQHFYDLKGKRIGLWKKGGQYDSFLDIADHFGLTETDFIFVGNNLEESNAAFQNNQADAIFRVRALGNQSISQMVQLYQGRLVPIEQAAAMQIKYPAFEPAIIPKGAYRGSRPTVPDTDLVTVAVQRLLIASDQVPSAIIQEINTILDVYRQEIADYVPNQYADIRPLVAQFSQPENLGAIRVPIHPGTIAYYERDKPSFIQENSDYLALLLTIVLLFGSWLFELKSWLERRRKDEADRHIETFFSLMTAVQSRNHHPIQALRKLDQVFTQAAKDLIDEKISQESFRTLSEAYKAVRELILHHARTLPAVRNREAENQVNSRDVT